jgi:signal peptidase I
LCTIFAFVIIIWLLLFSILSYFIQPVQQNWQSMFPAIYDRQFLLAHNFINNYKRWDIILFKNNDNLDIKRIIWLPNDELKIDDWKVFIYNGTEYQELDEIYLNEQNKNSTRVRWISEDISYYIPDWMYFVMWDNRQYSTDSRTCFSTCREWEIEFLAREDILGKVYFDLWYFDFETRAFKHPVFLIPTYPRFFNID